MAGGDCKGSAEPKAIEVFSAGVRACYSRCDECADSKGYYIVCG